MIVTSPLRLELPNADDIDDTAHNGDFSVYVQVVVDAIKRQLGEDDTGLTDLIIDADAPPRFYIHGRWYHSNLNSIPAALMANARDVLNPAAQKLFDENMDAPGRLQLDDGSLIRLHLYKANLGTCAVLRLQPPQPYSWAQMGLPDSILACLDRPQGLILYSGPVGSRKTAAAHAMLDDVNNRYDDPSHILMIQDPPEATHKNRAAIFHDREIGFTALDYETAIYGSGLRALPRYILMGEMRDPRTIEAALMAASLGKLVISTIHSETSYQTISRLKKPFPTDRQPEILETLRDSLLMIINLRLVPGTDGKSHLAYEILNMDRKAKEHIEDLRLLSNDLDHDDTSIRLETCLSQMWRDHKITTATAIKYANDPQNLDNELLPR